MGAFKFLQILHFWTTCMWGHDFCYVYVTLISTSSRFSQVLLRLYMIAPKIIISLLLFGHLFYRRLLLVMCVCHNVY